MKKYTILLFLLMLSAIYLNAQDTERYTIKHLSECNDEQANFGTTYYGENQVIYSSPKKPGIIKRNWKPNKQPFLELFLADVSGDGELINRKKISSSVNSKYHESNVAFTNDMQTVYFSRDKYFDKKLDKDPEGITHISMYKADVVSAEVWENIVELPFNNADYSTGHPTLSEDNKTLYFSSNRNGNDDIYSVSIGENGTYGSPIRLGSNVNTLGSERFPFIASGNILYFSSDRAGGMGKLDVYAVKLDGRSKAINLGAPINSYKDDFSFTMKKGSNVGYFSSNRGNGKGDDDIYYFEETHPLPCSQIAQGIVTDKLTGKRIPRALVLLFDANGDEIDSQIVGSDAVFVFDIDCSSNYRVQGSKENYSEDEKSFTSNANLELGLDLGLSIEKAPSVPDALAAFAATEFDRCQSALDNINNIYFDLDKYYIRADAASELDKVVRIMRRCKNITVDATSHTDSRASHSYNEVLSQNRAQSTVDYIVNIGGIAPNRIKAIGYGETRLRNRCSDNVKCSEPEHQMNRRTQFEISNY